MEILVGLRTFWIFFRAAVALTKHQKGGFIGLLSIT